MIVLLVLVNNWLELLPIVDTFGWLEPAHGTEAFEPQELGGGWYYIDGNHPAEGQHHGGGEGEGSTGYAEEVAVDDGHGGEGGAEGLCTACHIVPFIRVASTDLNFTLAIAAISVVITQVIGFQALGFSYLNKYFN